MMGAIKRTPAEWAELRATEAAKDLAAVEARIGAREAWWKVVAPNQPSDHEMEAHLADVRTAKHLGGAVMRHRRRAQQLHAEEAKK